jgi:hypothetical protein
MNQAAQTNLTILPIGAWAFVPARGESVRILDVETVWNHTAYHVWITRLATVERVPAESLSPAKPTKATGLDRITYAVAAARIADALTQDVLLAPLEAGVIPFPHQREQEKGNYAFQVRREALHRLGLPEVRQHRLKRVDEEERAWAAELRKREQILPELQPVILLRVEAGNG